jgi:excisionase family DNA binding protein
MVGAAGAARKPLASLGRPLRGCAPPIADAASAPMQSHEHTTSQDWNAGTRAPRPRFAGRGREPSEQHPMHNDVDSDSQAGSQRLLTVDDVAERAQLSTKTIYRALERGQLRGAKLGGRGARGGAWRIHPLDFDAWYEGSVPTSLMAPQRQTRPRRPATSQRGSLRALAAAESGATT